jgi:hypothetical protein
MLTDDGLLMVLSPPWWAFGVAGDKYGDDADDLGSQGWWFTGASAVDMGLG